MPRDCFGTDTLIRLLQKLLSVIGHKQRLTITFSRYIPFSPLSAFLYTRLEHCERIYLYMFCKAQHINTVSTYADESLNLLTVFWSGMYKEGDYAEKEKLAENKCKPKTRTISKFSTERSVCPVSINFFSLTFLKVSVFFELSFVGTAVFFLPVYFSVVNKYDRFMAFIKFCTHKWSFKCI